MATSHCVVNVYPYPLTNLSVTDGTSTITVGDGITDSGSYYTFDCGTGETLPTSVLTFSADDWVSFDYECYTDTVHTVSFTKPEFLYAYTDPNPVVDTPLYAWTSVEVGETIYTRSNEPDTSSVIVNNVNTPIANYLIDSIVSDTIIDVARGHSVNVPYYGFNCINQITINAASGYSGTFTRDYSSDGEITYTTAAGRGITTYGFGWVQGAQVIYTLLSSPRPGTDWWIVNGESLNNTEHVATVSTPENVFLKTETLTVNEDVYNSSFEFSGAITEVLNSVTIGGVTYTGFSFNNKKYYRDTSSDTTHPEIEYDIDPYTRDSTSDIIVPSTLPETLYTDSTTLVLDMRLYDDTGIHTDYIIDEVISEDSFNITSIPE